jgi:hypothetical protein
MFRPSWDHHQAVHITNAIKLVEIAMWIHIVQRVCVIKVVDNCTLYYDDKLQHWEYSHMHEFVFKNISGGN